MYIKKSKPNNSNWFQFRGQISRKVFFKHIIGIRSKNIINESRYEMYRSGNIPQLVNPLALNPQLLEIHHIGAGSLSVGTPVTCSIYIPVYLYMHLSIYSYISIHMQMTFYKIEHANLYIWTYSFTWIYTHVYSKNQLQTDRCQLKSCSRIFLTKLPVKCVLWNFHYV